MGSCCVNTIFIFAGINYFSSWCEEREEERIITNCGTLAVCVIRPVILKNIRSMPIHLLSTPCRRAEGECDGGSERGGHRCCSRVAGGLSTVGEGLECGVEGCSRRAKGFLVGMRTRRRRRWRVTATAGALCGGGERSEGCVSDAIGCSCGVPLMLWRGASSLSECLFISLEWHIASFAEAVLSPAWHWKLAEERRVEHSRVVSVGTMLVMRGGDA